MVQKNVIDFKIPLTVWLSGIKENKNFTKRLQTAFCECNFRVNFNLSQNFTIMNNRTPYLAGLMLIGSFFLFAAFSYFPISPPFVATPDNSESELAECTEPKAIEYSTICITNTLEYELHYQFRWGNGEWEQFHLEPNHYNTHYIQGTHLTGQAWFDSDFDDRNVWKGPYNLRHCHDLYADCEHAAQYKFMWSGNWNSFDIYDTQNYCQH